MAEKRQQQQWHVKRAASKKRGIGVSESMAASARNGEQQRGIRQPWRSVMRQAKSISVCSVTASNSRRHQAWRVAARRLAKTVMAAALKSVSSGKRAIERRHHGEISVA